MESMVNMPKQIIILLKAFVTDSTDEINKLIENANKQFNNSLPIP